jgi:Fe-S oxidoreductase
MLLWLLVLAMGVIAAWRFLRVLQPVFGGVADPRFNQPARRLRGLLQALFHRRLLRMRFAGTLHAMIFVSFFVLFSSIVETFGGGLFPGFSLAPLGGDSWIALLQDIFAVVMLAGVAMAGWQRYVRRPVRFKGSSVRDASVIYALIVVIVVSMLLQAAFAMAAAGDVAKGWRPVAGAIAAVLPGGAAGATGAEIAFWIHATAILAFLVYIPGSKHRHMFLAAPNVYFRSLEPKGKLPAPPAERSSAGLESIDQLSWKNKLDLLVCTECGRCQSACPAFAAGQPLSPKLLIMDLRDAMLPGAPDQGAAEALIGGTIRPETLWACTSCRACMEVCPVHIEHLPKIVDMRRTLVESGEMEPMLREALSNLQRTGNSMGKPGKMRARWTKDLAFKVADARDGPVDILWFVGDYASYDPRAQQVTRKVAELLQAAGADFAILYEAERNSGNDVRRVGEEGLFDILARSNLETLAGCQFKRIMTTDPHSLNALRNEYPALGGNFTVLHYTDVLLELLIEGRLKLRPGAGATVTYHDPCYLGRYNGGFDAPRALIERAGYRLHDMPRCRENSFCCGAGGGRIWMDDSAVAERPSENRIKEALALGTASYFVVACPMDKVMYTAAAQALGVESRLEVRDIAELLELEGQPAMAGPSA